MGVVSSLYVRSYDLHQSVGRDVGSESILLSHICVCGLSYDFDGKLAPQLVFAKHERLSQTTESYHSIYSMIAAMNLVQICH